jgi:hypothetical protein
MIAIIDILMLAMLIASVWTLFAILVKLHVIWQYWLTLIFPMSIMMSMGLFYFDAYRIFEWIGKLTSN